MSNKPDSKPRTARALLVSLAVHGAIVAIAVLFVVSRYIGQEEETEFVAQPRVPPPSRASMRLGPGANKRDAIAVVTGKTF